MKNLNVYLFFPGNCQEAINFYKQSLGGEIAFMGTYGESPEPCADADKNKIMHTSLKADGITIMASDCPTDQPVVNGNNISLSLNFSDEKEQETIFTNLSSGGNVTMPLQDTFWGAKFGMLTDKFGINWMVNCEKAKK